jgi:preprotein translocase subunit SecA
MLGLLKKIFGTSQERRVRQYRSVMAEVNRLEEEFQQLSDEQVRAKTDEFRRRLGEGETLDQLLPEAFAVVKNVCRRLCGTEIHVSGYNQRWDMIPYDVQIIGGIAMHHGSIAEMHTGEGKTLTATMPLYLNALTGDPVHLVTVNDYLAQRDCEWVGGVLRWLGLTTGVLTNGVPLHERKSVYACDVVYGTASEFGFDYLRDNSMANTAEEQVQRGFYFAMIDETDSILIDEARTPLIISGPVPESRQKYDELKGGVYALVRRQLHLCTRLSNEARKELEELGLMDEEAQPRLSKQEGARRDVAMLKLWKVSKGMPRNKVLKRARENPDLRGAVDKLETYYSGQQTREERSAALSELLMTVEERSSEYELTDAGVRAWVEEGHGAAEDFIMLDLGHAYAEIESDEALSSEERLQKKVQVREQDAERKERAHNLRQLLRGHLLMERDVDYMVQGGKVVIIDENTGRPQPGRRFSDGLHQAIEAKEAVKIEQETQTYATVTLQNFFRMYDKIAGMTGTAMTEAHELKEIYKLEVLEIPTYRPCQRDDQNDSIYMTEREKYNAILEEVRREHEKGRPILLGTESVEVSEKLARIFKRAGLPHTVLNAKYHGQEAEIIANAGARGAITIATNMAGRGTDIKLKDNVAECGGMHVLGASRHQSRRIDRQLRGRSGRLGDPGSSHFFISFEDPLMRRFASPRLSAWLTRLRPPEGEAIQGGILNRSIETAQKRVEQQNSMMRKHTLEYDDVMNKQRQEIYDFRNEILHAEDVATIAEEILHNVCAQQADLFFGPERDAEGYRQWLMTHFPVSFEEGAFEDDLIDIETVIEQAAERVTEAFHEKLTSQRAKTETTATTDPVTQAVRSVLTRGIDQLWQEHLLAMDHLRSEVSLRSVAQKDPLMEFKQEAFTLFGDLSLHLREKMATDLFRFEIVPYATGHLEGLLSRMRMETDRALTPGEGHGEGLVREALKPAPTKVELPSVGRNDDCPCGSGKKYKRCCGQDTATTS